MVRNKEKKKEYNKKWYQEHKDEQLAYARKMYKKRCENEPDYRKKENVRHKKIYRNRCNNDPKYRKIKNEKQNKWHKKRCENDSEYTKMESKRKMENYHKHLQNDPEYGRKKHNRMKERNRWLVDIFLYPYKCFYCNKKYDEVCLDFHHLNPNIKSFEISSRRHRVNINPLELIHEMLKCIILCSNCHRLVEAGKIRLKNIENRLV